MRKIEYLRITELNMQGSRINELGAEGWKLMHVYPAGHEQDGRCRPNWYTEYLFMREPEVKDELFRGDDAAPFWAGYLLAHWFPT